MPSVQVLQSEHRISGSFGPQHSAPVYALQAFRKTRQGTTFSPWSRDFGIPLHAPQDFSLSQHIACAAARFDMLVEHDEDGGVDSIGAMGASAVHAGPDMLSDRRAGVAQDAHSQSPALASLSANTTCASSNKSAPAAEDNLSKEKYHAKMRAKRRRQLARERDTQALDSAGRKLKAIAKKRRATAIAIHLDNVSMVARDGKVTASRSFLANRMPISKTAYVAQRIKASPVDSRSVEKQELLDSGFEYVAWDGRDPRPMVDQDGTVFAVLVGRPRDASWDDVVRKAASLLNNARAACGVDNATVTHRRGAYACITTGISYGGGQTRPRTFANSDRVQRVLDDLVQSKCIQRLANFGNSAFKLFGHRLHQYYKSNLEQLCAHDATLRLPFADSAFAACTFNLGPKTVTYVHTDGLNLPWGWCAVTALGDYDPVNGGHIILWDLRMIIEFPPGATILLPSAVLRHSNTQLGQNESRFSFTQYSAGGLFRWVECGFRSKKDFDLDRSSDAAPLEQTGQARWESGLEMLSNWSEFTQSPDN